MAETRSGASETSSFSAWLEACRAWAETILDEVLPAPDAHPARLHLAMRHALLSGGKRLRPALLRTVAQAMGGRDADAAIPGAAIELVHTYSLVHDDLPCMDDDELRRGMPTVHVAFDEATAVLVGDALLTLAFELLAERTGERAGPLASVLARAAGSRGMVGGQVVDLSLEQVTAKASLAEVEGLHTLKTAFLLGAAAEMGAIVAGGGADERNEVRAYGIVLGRLFQAVDDVLDVVGDAGTLGKTPGKDEAHERPTLVAALGLDGAREHAKKLAEEAQSRASELGWKSGQPAHDVVDFVLSRRA